MLIHQVTLKKLHSALVVSFIDTYGFILTVLSDVNNIIVICYVW